MFRPPVKVVRIITRLNIGGPAIHTVLLTRELASLGYTTTLVSGTCEPADGDMSYLLEPGDPVAWIPEMSRSVNPWKNLRALFRLWRLLRAEKPAIVHTHTAMAGALGRTAAILAGVPVIVHTFHGNSLRDYFSPFVNTVFLQIERLLAKATDTICVVSEQQAGELSGEFRIAPRSRFRVVPLGLDLSAFTAMPPPVLDHGPLRVGWFGRMVPVKNIPLLVQVIESTLAQTDNVEFHVAGDGSERELLEQAARRLAPRLVWHGWQKDIAPIVEKCHVLLQTSRNEGTPVALIQGMAAARPFLSTAVGGVVDMVSGPKVRRFGGGDWYPNAVLASPEPASFAACLLELSQHPAQLVEIGQQARLFASNRYREEALVETLDSLYRDLLHKKLPHYAFPEPHSAVLNE